MDYRATFDVLFYLNEIMDLHMLNLGTLVSEGSCSKVSSLQRSDTQYAFYAGTLTLYHMYIQRKTNSTYRGQ